jgi:GT2 family glycosyltransferase
MYCIDKKNLLVSIVIPVYNRKAITLNCLKQLKSVALDGFSTKVIVVDDGSTDGTCDAIRKQYPNTVLLHGNGSLWWAGAVNLGVRYALEAESDYILTLNDDTYFGNDFIKELLLVANDHPNAIIGSITAYRNSTEDLRLCQAGIFLSPYFKNITHKIFYKDELGKSKVIFTDGLSGRSLLIASNIFKEIGFFDENLFPHGSSDYEFTLRAQKKGFKSLIATRSLIRTDINQNNYTIHLVLSDWPTYLRSFFNKKYTNCLRTIFFSSFMHKDTCLGLLSWFISMARILKWSILKLLLSQTSLKRIISEKNYDAAVLFGENYKGQLTTLPINNN